MTSAVDNSLVCFFCHAFFENVPNATLYRSIGWSCPECQQYNGFSELSNTGYNRLIPEMHEQLQAHRAYSQLQTPATSSTTLCDTCLHTMQRRIDMLAKAVPPENSEQSVSIEARNYYSEADAQSRAWAKAVNADVEKQLPLCQACEKLTQQFFQIPTNESDASDVAELPTRSPSPTVSASKAFEYVPSEIGSLFQLSLSHELPVTIARTTATIYKSNKSATSPIDSIRSFFTAFVSVCLRAIWFFLLLFVLLVCHVLVLKSSLSLWRLQQQSLVSCDLFIPAVDQALPSIYSVLPWSAPCLPTASSASYNPLTIALDIGARASLSSVDFVEMTAEKLVCINASQNATFGIVCDTATWRSGFGIQSRWARFRHGLLLMYLYITSDSTAAQSMYNLEELAHFVDSVSIVILVALCPALSQCVTFIHSICSQAFHRKQRCCSTRRAINVVLTFHAVLLLVAAVKVLIDLSSEVESTQRSIHLSQLNLLVLPLVLHSVAALITILLSALVSGFLLISAYAAPKYFLADYDSIVVLTEALSENFSRRIRAAWRLAPLPLQAPLDCYIGMANLARRVCCVTKLKIKIHKTKSPARSSAHKSPSQRGTPQLRSAKSPKSSPATPVMQSVANADTLIKSTPRAPPIRSNRFSLDDYSEDEDKVVTEQRERLQSLSF